MRLTLQEYLAEITKVVALRSTCKKLQVGAIIVRDGHPISTGYNGSVKDQPHCTDIGCLLDDKGKCIRTIHAEQNAITQAAKLGVKVEGCDMYVTHTPCFNCAKHIIQAGIKRVFVLDEYKISMDTLTLIVTSGLELHNLKK